MMEQQNDSGTPSFYLSFSFFGIRDFSVLAGVRTRALWGFYPIAEILTPFKLYRFLVMVVS